MDAKSLSKKYPQPLSNKKSLGNKVSPFPGPQTQNLLPMSNDNSEAEDNSDYDPRESQKQKPSLVLPNIKRSYELSSNQSSNT
jgi:hypothetical protein